MQLETDAFSNGQVDSKLWAAVELEQCVIKNNIGSLDMYILGGWYALLHFMLQIRNNITINSCRSFDLDPSACSMANVINNTWEKNDWQFRAYPQDINTLDYPLHVNCVVNTITEHVKSRDWFDRIPRGTLCLIQSNNLIHQDHVATVNSIDELKNTFPLDKIMYEGSKALDSYTRFMIIGKK